jgi:hypothetical protein
MHAGVLSSKVIDCSDPGTRNATNLCVLLRPLSLLASFPPFLAHRSARFLSLFLLPLLAPFFDHGQDQDHLICLYQAINQGLYMAKEEAHQGEQMGITAGPSA